MSKGAAIKFKSYEETVPKILEILNLQKELKKHDSIIIKVNLTIEDKSNTNKEFLDSVLSFVMKNKNPVTKVSVAEGSEGHSTSEFFELAEYQEIADKHGISLLDLNTSETEEIRDGEFLKFDSIHYPKILLNSFIISITKLSENEESVINGTLSNMIGAFPLKHYKGFFSSKKNKIRKNPIKYAIHDILKCKMPEFGIIDASEKEKIIAGIPLEIEKQAAKLIDLEWKNVPYLKLAEESFSEKQEKD